MKPANYVAPGVYDPVEDQIKRIVTLRPLLPNQSPFKFGEFRYGRMLYYYYDIFVSSSLEQYGEWSQLEIDFMCRLLSPGDKVIDIGAFVGTHTLAFADRVGKSGKVYAYEPMRNSFNCVSTNLMVNEFNNCEVFQLALGKENGHIDFIDTPDVRKINNYGGLGSIAHSAFCNETSEIDKVKVKMATLDSFNFTECKLIKIDSEGMELDILKGAVRTIEKCKPCIFTEVESPEYGKPMETSATTQALIEFVHKFNYAVYDATSSLFNPNNYFGNAHDMFGNIVSFAVFCCPNNWNVNGLPNLG